MKTLSILIVLSAPALFAQGPLDPSGPPAPSQKSLQEIWDALQTAKTIVAAQQGEIAALQGQKTTLLNHGKLLHYASGGSLPWTVTTVARVDVFQPSLAFGPEGQPAISYIDEINDKIMFARFDGGSWEITTVDSVGEHSSANSLAYGPDGQPAISYRDDTDDDLKFARFDGSTWEVTTVDSGEFLAFSCSLAFGPDGQPAISYSDSEGPAGPYEYLKFAQFDGSTWEFTTVDTGVVSTFGTSLAFGPDGQPAISYSDSDGPAGPDANLMFARFDGSTWNLTIVDSDGRGSGSSLAFGPDGLPAISYDDYPDFYLEFARFDGSTWNLTTLTDAGGDSYTSLAFGPDGQPAISYKDFTNNELIFARFDGSTWNFTTLDRIGGVGSSTSLAFGPDGQPAISYASAGDLKFARMGASLPAP